jgi:hypothetical protein
VRKSQEDEVSKTEQSNPFQALEPISQTPVEPPAGIAALALNFAMQYYNINTVQDGALYQQYKMEGRNIRNLHLSDILETATEIEAHLLKASERLAELVAGAISLAERRSDESSDPQLQVKKR